MGGLEMYVKLERIWKEVVLYYSVMCEWVFEENLETLHSAYSVSWLKIVCAAIFVNRFNPPACKLKFIYRGKLLFFCGNGAYAGIISHYRLISQLSAVNWNGCGLLW
jgi:hypothetical protein